MLVSTLVAARQQRRAFEALQDLLEAAPLTAGASESLVIDPRFSFRQVFQNSLGMEECFGLVAFGSGSMQDEVVRITPQVTFPFVRSALYRVFLWQGDMDVYRQCMDYQRRLAGLPYYQAAADWDRLAQGQLFRSRRIGNLLVPAVPGPAAGVAEADARHQLALLALAAGRYRAARGAWPDTLAALAPAYLPAVPADPFTGEPLKLTRRPDGQVVIYSVGRDLRDDAGAALDAKSHKGDVRLVLGGR